MPNQNITPLTANNTINDMRLKVNEIAHVVPSYDDDTANYFLSNTQIDSILTVIGDIILANNSINAHLANNYAHGVTVENVSFDVNTGIFTLGYNNLSTSYIDISYQDHVEFRHIDANTISTVNLDVTSNTNIGGYLTVDSDIFASSNVVVSKDITVTGNTYLNNIIISGESEIDTDLHVTGSAIIDLNLAVDGGNLTSTSNNFNLLSSPRVLNIGAGSTEVVVGSLTGNTAIRNDLRVAGDVFITGQELNSTTAIFNLLGSPATIINFASAASEVIIGSTSGTTAIRNNETVAGTLAVTGNTSVIGTLFVDSGTIDSRTVSANYLATPSSVTFAANTSSLTIGGTSGTTTIRNNEIVDGTLSVTGLATFTSNVSVNSGTILSSTPTVNVFPSSSSVIIGSTSGTTEIRNDVQLDKNLVVTGDLTVSGNTTIINTQTLAVEDKNIELGVIEEPTNTTANGGGITLKGSTDKTIIWDNTNGNWTSSEHWNINSEKVYKIDNVSVLSANTLGSSVVNSSLTSVGTLTTGTWSATTIAINKGGTGITSYNTGDILYADASGNLVKLPIGSTDQLLQVKSDGTIQWISVIDGGDY